MGWRPISTAPKGKNEVTTRPTPGPWLYLRHPDGRQIRAYWRAPIELWDGEANRKMPGAWYDQFDKQIDFEPEFWDEFG